ncbi:hypothetical protein C0J52_10662 [Blattella germanica]|nr:hypothetical protein C0J52_10662 [Blattella germanica]
MPPENRSLELELECTIFHGHVEKSTLVQRTNEKLPLGTRGQIGTREHRILFENTQKVRKYCILPYANATIISIERRNVVCSLTKVGTDKS